MSWRAVLASVLRVCGWAGLALGAGCAADGGPLEGFPDVPAFDGGAPCEAAEVAPEGIVTLDAWGRFSLDGRTFVPQAVNSYPLLQHVGEGRLDAVDDILGQAQALGRPIVRTPAFMDGGDHPARIREPDGSLREEGLKALDQVLAMAAEHGVRLLLILTNNWDDFGGAPAVMEMVAPGEKLPKNAFFTDARAIRAQLAYQDALVARINTVNGRAYKTDPTIFAWELMNEPRCERNQTPQFCAEGTLSRWARTMSDGLRKAGVRQLIAWGGSGYLGDYGEDLRSVAHEGGVDVLTLHMYARYVQPGPGESRARAAIRFGLQTLRSRADVAREAGLPLLLEEVNYLPDDGPQRDLERATVLAAWLDEARELAIGTAPWMIGELGREDYDGYLIRPSHEASMRAVECH